MPVLIGAAFAWSALSSRPVSLDDRVRRLESEIRCPVCQGLSIADSPALTAQQMRAVVIDQLAAGASDDAVRAYFVERYGRWILLVPAASGPGAALWLAPALFVVAGAGLVGFRARARRRTADVGLRSSPDGQFGRLGSALIAVAILGAIAAPIAVAVGPRLAGQQISGTVGGVQANPSIELLEAARRANPNDSATLVALGDAYLAANRGDAAIDAYEQALRADPNNVPALLQVGVILLSAGRPADAGPLFDRVLAQNPDQPDALVYRGLARFQLEGRLTEAAREDVVRFLAVAPSDPRRAMVEQLLAGAAPSPSP
ncbi:MAG: cytochrome c-type biogenesis protein CcmH [Chloroflexi bacterium]|nr:cytochrome c-type biogenesis protein CcmH [Chloroflexota bacterium]